MHRWALRSPKSRAPYKSRGIQVDKRLYGHVGVRFFLGAWVKGGRTIGNPRDHSKYIPDPETVFESAMENHLV